ncbi:hypothetical protein SAMN04487925_103288 [Bradyrhizobium sp. cf659]|nr:hypothetical protein SAMN04487925_103288 [Bradyrhizobium sp. cf659]
MSLHVMAGLDPAVHAQPQLRSDVDARDKPGHDDHVCNDS